MTSPTNVWIKLHTGDPGEAGTANAATETTRVQASFAAASGGSISTNADLDWTSVSTTETYSHVTMLDTVGPAGGNVLAKAALTASKAVTAGDDFKIASGDLTFTLD